MMLKMMMLCEYWSLITGYVHSHGDQASKLGSHQRQEDAALFISISSLPYRGIFSAHSSKIYEANPIQP